MNHLHYLRHLCKPQPVQGGAELKGDRDEQDRQGRDQKGDRVTHRRYERVFMRVCERFQLNPSRWIPHFTPTGIYEMGHSYSTARAMFSEDGELQDGEEVPIPCFSIYSMFESICRERARKRLNLDGNEWVRAKLGFWHEFWGFLAEVDMGIFDSTAWGEPVEIVHEDDMKVEFRRHERKGEE